MFLVRDDLLCYLSTVDATYYLLRPMKMEISTIKLSAFSMHTSRIGNGNRFLSIFYEKSLKVLCSVKIVNRSLAV